MLLCSKTLGRQMFLDYDSQKSWPAQLMVKASGSLGVRNYCYKASTRCVLVRVQNFIFSNNRQVKEHQLNNLGFPHIIQCDSRMYYTLKPFYCVFYVMYHGVVLNTKHTIYISECREAKYVESSLKNVGEIMQITCIHYSLMPISHVIWGLGGKIM